MSYDIVEHHNMIQQMLDAGLPFCVITLIDIRGSAPQVVGAKAIVSPAGIVGGTVGGGKIEAAATAHAQHLLSAGCANDWVTWNLQTDIGMTCGGEVKLFFEVHAHTKWPIVVFGAGHVSQALVRLLLTLDCHVSCIDTRTEWLDRLPSHAKLTKLLAEEPRQLVSQLPNNAYFVLMSKGHATDLPVLGEILQSRQSPFVGVIGSKQKASVLRRDLQARNLPTELINSFHCPVGLDIGNNTPAEIAISIVAQLLQHRDAGGMTK